MGFRLALEASAGSASAEQGLVRHDHLGDDGHLDRDDFRAFTCDNAIELLGGARPDFFEGTVVEDYAKDYAKTRAKD